MGEDKEGTSISRTPRKILLGLFCFGFIWLDMLWTAAKEDGSCPYHVDAVRFGGGVAEERGPWALRGKDEGEDGQYLHTRYIVHSIIYHICVQKKFCQEERNKQINKKRRVPMLFFSLFSSRSPSLFTPSLLLRATSL